ncbi:hypothetical protein JTB14_004201 [Gonioctena quinquepunctata]|nr:hypothetical protein JTB14_004201 [Gonioctena quinquepunctata]
MGFALKNNGIKKARGFQEPVKGSEYCYAPVCRMQTIRMLIYFASQYNRELKQVDVPTDFLNGFIDHSVYIITPEGINNDCATLKLNPGIVWTEKSTLLFWNERFNEFMVKLGFSRSKHDFCLYYKNNLFLVLFIDDVLTTSKEEHIEQVIKNIENAENFVGVEIKKDYDNITVCQPKLIDTLLKKYNMDFCKSVASPMEVGFQSQIQIDKPIEEDTLVCGLMYISVTTRPDAAALEGS